MFIVLLPFRINFEDNIMPISSKGKHLAGNNGDSGVVVFAILNRDEPRTF
jgi:hypothetical protein